MALKSEFSDLLSVLKTLVRLLELSSWSSVFNYFCIRWLLLRINYRILDYRAGDEDQDILWKY